MMQHCWNENPDRRPPFSEIKSYLQGHLNISASKSNSTRHDNTQAAAYHLASDQGCENAVEMRDMRPGSQAPRNDYLSLMQEPDGEV